MRHRLLRSALTCWRRLHVQPPLSGMDLPSIVARLEQLAPTDGAEEWDNVGLLLEPSKNPTVERVLLTNDLTEEVVDEALSLPGKKVGLIVSYHPPIFSPLRRLTQVSAKERIILRCVASQLAIYSPHTALDRQINGWLVQGLGSGILTHFSGSNGTKDPSEGSGSLYTLSAPVGLSTIVSRAKSLLGLSYVRLASREGAGGADPQVSTIAAVVGSGGSLLKGVCADVYVTGEMSHHGVLDATSRGTSVILTEHSNCERPFLWQTYKKMIEGRLDGKVDVHMSQVDRDPLRIV